MIPENKGAPEASATPKQRGKATKNTTSPAERSLLRYLNENSFNIFIFIFLNYLHQKITNEYDKVSAENGLITQFRIRKSNQK